LSDLAPARPAFSHPAEEEFSRILDFYGVQWEYEPRTFALEWDEQGNVTRAFTPDFYLPEEDTYVEVTTLRPRLNTVKNKKLRLMAELYPGVTIKLFKRSAVHDLFVKYGLDGAAGPFGGGEAQKLP
jgi:hypoxanthine phosphoribosyltransferase